MGDNMDIFYDYDFYYGYTDDVENDYIKLKDGTLTTKNIFWIDKYGERHALSEMDNNYIQNCINLLNRSIEAITPEILAEAPERYDGIKIFKMWIYMFNYELKKREEKAKENKPSYYEQLIQKNEIIDVLRKENEKLKIENQKYKNFFENSFKEACENRKYMF